MFFSISTEKFDDRFFIHHKVSQYYISLDAGWQQTNINGKEIFYKGYCDTLDMSAVAADFAVDPTPRYTGNFGIIVVDDNSLVLSNDIPRSFPLNINNGFLTNLTTENSSQSFWADDLVMYNQKNIETVKINIFKDLDLNFDETLTLDECASRIKNIINDKLDFVNRSSLDKKMFLTGGVDTTLIYAISQSNLDNIKIINYEHLDYDKFLLKNYSRLKKEYKIYSHGGWCSREPSIVFSGAPGDEFFLRGPFMSGLWSGWHNFDLVELLNRNPDCYHRKFYFRDSVKKVIKDHYANQQNIKNTYQSYHELCLYILDNCANDHQVWHLNNTLTWSPFKDLKILSTVLKLNKDDLIGQVMDAKLSKHLISLYDSDSLNLMDQYKNEDNFNNLLSHPKIGKLFE